MTASSQKNHYQLLDIAADARREDIALGYQRGLEALAREHNADPNARAALRAAYDVLSDPIQRRMYDLSVHPRQSAQISVENIDLGDDSGEAATSAQRFFRSAWGRALIVGLVLIGLMVWIKSGKSSTGNALPAVNPQATATSAGTGVTSSDSATAKPDARVQSGVATSTGPRTAEDIFNQVSQSVVRINVATAGGLPVASGSGVVIGPAASLPIATWHCVAIYWR